MLGSASIRSLVSSHIHHDDGMHGWSHEDFAVIYRGISRWKNEGRREALWLNYIDHAAAKRAYSDLIKHHHVGDASVLGNIVIVNDGIGYLEQEVNSITVNKHFDAKLRAALLTWQQKGANKPLSLEFTSPYEVHCAKEKLREYLDKDSEGPVSYGNKLVMSTALAAELAEVM